MTRTAVTFVAAWTGWCTPCQSQDRPLVLTRSGPGGVRSWLAGLGDDDRLLLLTCRLCGDWQVVPAREQDDPEVPLLEDDLVGAAVLDDAVLQVAAPEVVLPAPREADRPVLRGVQDAARPTSCALPSDDLLLPTPLVAAG